MNRSRLVVTLILIIMAPGLAHGSITARGSSLEVYADVAFYGNPADLFTSTARDIATEIDSQFGSIHLLASVAQAEAVNGPYYARSYSEAEATWNSPAAGQVNFLVGYDTNSNVRHSVSNLGLSYMSSLGWSYTFSASWNGVIILNYDVEFFGPDTFGLAGFNLEFDGREVNPLFTFIDPARSPGVVYQPK